MVNPQKNRSFLSRQGNSVAFRQSRGRPSARARLTAPLGQCFFALEARLTYPKRCCSARPLPADAPLLHFPLWSRGWRFVPSIRPNGDPQLTCSRAAFIFLDELPRRRQHFAALVYGFRFEGASAQDFAGMRAINLREHQKSTCYVKPFCYHVSGCTQKGVKGISAMHTRRRCRPGKPNVLRSRLQVIALRLFKEKECTLSSKLAASSIALPQVTS